MAVSVTSLVVCLTTVSSAEDRVDPVALLHSQIERASAIGGERGATCALSAQVEAMMAVFASPHSDAFEYYKEIFTWLGEHGTEDALPSLEMWLNSYVQWDHKKARGYANLVWNMLDDATLAWYRIKARDMTEVERGEFLLSLLFPGRCSTLAAFDAIPVAEYGSYLPSVKDQFYGPLLDKTIPLEGKNWPHYMYVRGPRYVGRIMACAHDLWPPDRMEDVLLAQTGTYGHFAYLGYVEELRSLCTDLEPEDKEGAERRIAKLAAHLPRLLASASSTDERRRYLNTLDIMPPEQRVPHLVKLGRRLMRGFRLADSGLLDSIVCHMHGAPWSAEAEKFLRDYVAWAEGMREEHPELGNSLALAEDILRKWAANRPQGQE